MHVTVCNVSKCAYIYMYESTFVFWSQQIEPSHQLVESQTDHLLAAAKTDPVVNRPQPTTAARVSFMSSRFLIKHTLYSFDFFSPCVLLQTLNQYIFSIWKTHLDIPCHMHASNISNCILHQTTINITHESFINYMY